VTATPHRESLPGVVALSQEFRASQRVSASFVTKRVRAGGSRPGKDTVDPTILVNKRGVQEQYGIPINTQEDLYRKGLFAPQLKVGGKIYYRRSELEAWLDARAVGGDGTA
jgi:hypothetical protein